MLPPEAARLTPDMLGRGVLKRRGDPNPLRRVASALKRGEQVDIVVFGGSVTSGVGTRGCRLPGCERPQKGHECRACAWPSQLEAGLKLAYPQARVAVHNLAVRVNPATSQFLRHGVTAHASLLVRFGPHRLLSASSSSAWQNLEEDVAGAHVGRSAR